MSAEGEWAWLEGGGGKGASLFLCLVDILLAADTVSLFFVRGVWFNSHDAAWPIGDKNKSFHMTL